MTELTANELRARSRNCLALDFPTTEQALENARFFAPYVGMVKVGKEIHTSAGNEGIRIFDMLHTENLNSFADLKFHDTPNTVKKAAMALCVPGVTMFNLHIEGGEAMCKAALEGAYEGAQKAGLERPKVIGLTVLTSLNDKDLTAQGINVPYDDLVKLRTELAVNWRLDGVVCPASKAGTLEKKYGSRLLYVTPGIEWAGVFREGQKQLYTPDRAVQDCKNSILVLGGALTNAGNVYETGVDGKKVLAKKGTWDDKRKAAYEILQAMAPYV